MFMFNFRPLPSLPRGYSGHRQGPAACFSKWEIHAALSIRPESGDVSVGVSAASGVRMGTGHSEQRFPGDADGR
jgi:hypothetical protein